VGVVLKLSFYAHVYHLIMLSVLICFRITTLKRSFNQRVSLQKSQNFFKEIYIQEFLLRVVSRFEMRLLLIQQQITRNESNTDHDNTTNQGNGLGQVVVPFEHGVRKLSGRKHYVWL
jgi:hypothetical protein